MPGPKEYLGDAVYADFTRYGDVILTTEDGIGGAKYYRLGPTSNYDTAGLY